MSQPAHRQVATPRDAPAVEPFASVMEYAQRLGRRQAWMLEQLARLRERPDPWIVAGPARIESWHVGAIAVGRPGVFLIWPMATRVEPALWATVRECRAHMQRCLGEQSSAVVEIVVFSPSDERGHMQRWMDTEDDVLTAHGHDLDRLLAEWEPISGVYLSDHWFAAFERSSMAREALYGPDTGAHQQHPDWSPSQASTVVDRPDP